MKRSADLLLVCATAPLWMPLAALVAAAVFFFMGSPVLYVDERAGLGGRPFRMVKFRSMRNGSGSDAERLGRFGRVLRAMSLDEIPEVWNVIRGEMSLVGPRPLPVRYLSRYTPQQSRRHEVSPGITGWAQVNGRNSLSWEDKLRYDVEYVDAHSLRLDLKILAMTIWQVVFPRHISHEGEATMSEFVGTAG